MNTEEQAKTAESAEEVVHIHVGEPDTQGRRVTPWSWVPTVNFAQGLQYAIVIQMFAIVFFTMGVDMGMTLFWVGFLSLPWTLKPLWGPLVDKYGTKRQWTVFMQLTVGLCFAGTAFALLLPGTGPFGLPWFLFVCLIFLFVLAFAAATHDIACDGFYMLALNQRQQAFFVGIRSTAFRIAMIFANGVLIWIAGIVQSKTGPPAVALMVDAAQSATHFEEIDRTGRIPPEIEGNGQRILLDPINPTVLAGQSTTVTLRLSAPPEPGQTQVVIFTKEKGADPAVNIPQEYQRIEIDETNWSTGVPVVIKAGDQIVGAVEGNFRVTAGNIPLSWAFSTALCAAFFLLAFLVHQFVLPRPAADFTDTTNRPPFHVPLIALGLTILVPCLIAWGVNHLLGYLRTPLLNHIFPGGDPTSLQTKGFNFGFTAGRLITLVLLATLVVKIPVLWAPVKKGFFTMSNWSQIGFAEVFETFFTKKGMAVTLGFLLTFRLGEAQLFQVKNLFLLDDRANLGIGLSLGQLAFTNTVVYMTALTVGGLLGGFVIAKFGLRKIIWYMVAAMHLPNLFYVYLAYVVPESFTPVNVAVAVESFGYGFGFASYLMIMIMAADGKYKTAHYALCTGAMALGFMLPGMWSGFLAELIGYRAFFIAVMFFTLPGIAFIPFLRIDPNFGVKKGT